MWVCAQLLSGIVGSIPAGVRILSLVGVVCCQAEFSGTARFLAQSSPTKCVCVCVCVCVYVYVLECVRALT